MPEVPNAGSDHGDFVFIRRFDYCLICNGAAGLDYGRFWSMMIENALRRKEEPWFSSEDVRIEYPFFWHHVLEQALSKKGRKWSGQ